jgi:uncharacterized protein (TIRG00374 family)
VKYKNILFTILRLIVGIGLLIFLFWRIETGKILGVLYKAEPILLVFSFILFIVAVFTISLRWKFLLLAHSIEIPFRRTTAYYFIGFFFNNFLPTVIGLDIVRAVYVSNTYGKRAECFASVISEKVIGVLGILILGTIFLPIFLGRDRSIVYIFILLFMLTIIFVVGIFLFPKRERLRGLRWVFKIGILKKLKDRIKRLYDALYFYKDKKPVLYRTLFLSVVYQMILISMVFTIGKALHIGIPYYYYLAFVPLINIGSMVPITPNGIGIREMIYIFLFNLAGIDPSRSILVSLLYFGITLLVSLPGAVIFIFGTEKRDVLGDGV